MHRSAHLAINAFFSSYSIPSGGRVLDLSAADPGRSVRTLMPAHAIYTGADTQAGLDVDIPLDDPSRLPFYDEHFHAVVSCYRLEHDAFFWLSFIDMLRVLKPGGLLLLCGPSNGFYHRSPQDSWRLYPDAGKSLEAWARKSGIAVELIESFIAPQLENDPWNDFVAVFQKAGTPALQPAMYKEFPAATNLWLSGSSFPQRETKLPEDRRKLQEAAFNARRVAVPEVAPSPVVAPEPVKVPETETRTCNICHGTEFGAGPAGRMAATGKPPLCRTCESLERQRIMHAVLEALPNGFLDKRTALRIGHHNGESESWFRLLHRVPFASGRSQTLDTAEFPDGSIDFISFNHLLEFVGDARGTFGELLRLLSPTGVMLGSFATPMARLQSEDFDKPVGVHGARHLFGQDLDRYFDCASQHVAVLAIEETDPCTDVREVVHLFVRQGPDLARIRKWLSGWNNTLAVMSRE